MCSSGAQPWFSTQNSTQALTSVFVKVPGAGSSGSYFLFLSCTFLYGLFQTSGILVDDGKIFNTGTFKYELGFFDILAFICLFAYIFFNL